MPNGGPKNDIKKLMCDGSLVQVSAEVDLRILRAMSKHQGCPFTDPELEAMIEASETAYGVLKKCLVACDARADSVPD